jgi:hypothetical protein
MSVVEFWSRALWGSATIKGSVEMRPLKFLADFWVSELSRLLLNMASSKLGFNRASLESAVLRDLREFCFAYLSKNSVAGTLPFIILETRSWFCTDFENCC